MDNSMTNLALIFVGSGLGGLSRYWVANLTYGLLGRGFPYGTLVVNVTGCFIMGCLFVLLIDRAGVYAPALRSLLLIGFLGGYTTFSTFAMETITLFEAGALLPGLLNALLSLTLCLLATGLGVLGGRQL